jgi:hypothetical protein
MEEESLNIMKSEIVGEAKHQKPIEIERSGLEMLSRWSEDLHTAAKMSNK